MALPITKQTKMITLLMGKIKIKDMEGEEEDLRRLFHMSRFSLSGYLNIDDRKIIPIFWLWILSFILYTTACCVWNNIFGQGWEKSRSCDCS